MVRKKDGSLWFCIDFRKLNSLTRKDSHPLPCIGETLDSLVGSAIYSTFDLTSGFWQVSMAEESKQYTAFTLGSMGLFECDRMPFGLCNAPTMFQRLMQNCLSELNLTYCLIYLDDVIVYSKDPEQHLARMQVVFERLREHGLKLKPSKCDLFKSEIIYLAHHVSKDGVKPSHKNVASILECPVSKTFTDICSFTGAVGHYRCFIKGFAKIAASLYDLTSGENKDKKSEPVTLTPEALEAFQTLKDKCVQAPVLTFPDFKKPFLLETDTSGKGLGTVLLQKQDDGHYHPIAFTSQALTETEQQYHSNKQEFLALKWAVTEQFHEYLSPYGKNRNEFVVRTDNNPLTYIFSSARLDAAGHRWVANLADYNFSLKYQRDKDNTVTDFLSQMEDRLSDEEVNEQIAKIPEDGVRAVLDNTHIPITDRGEVAQIRAKVGLNLPPAQACLAETLTACPARMTTLHVTDWKQAQKDDPALYAIVKNLRSPLNQFKDALKHVLDQKSIRDFVKARENLTMKNGLLYHKLRLKATGEDVWHFVVPKTHLSVALDGCHHEAAHQGQRRSFSLMQEWFWWTGMAHELKNHVRNCACCKKFEGAPPIAKLKKLPCSSPGEILHIDYTSIEETVNLNEKPVIRNVLVMQDHFSKHVVAYVVKDQKAKTAVKALRWGYFRLFGAPAYLVSDQGGAFTRKVVENLAKLYGVQKLRTSSYHAQTNGQVERMNQTLIRMIGKLDEEKKAHWSEYLPELLLSYNFTRSAVTGYSPNFLLFSRRLRIPVDYQFPTIHDLPHKAKLEESVADLQKRLKEAFEMARCLTSEEAVKQQHYYDHKAGAVALQPRDVVMVQTDRFVGKCKVKD